MKSILSVLLCCVMNLPQEFNEKRIIVISASEINSSIKKQIGLLKKESLKLEERKLAVFTLIDDEVTPIFNASKASESFVEKTKNRYRSDSEFKMHLIGLDQGIKRSFKDLILPKDIFTIVDSMPMRQTEMKKN